MGEPFRNKLLSDKDLMYFTGIGILQLMKEAGINDESYVNALIDLNEFPVSEYAAGSVLNFNKSGIKISDKLFQKAEHYLNNY